MKHVVYGLRVDDGFIRYVGKTSRKLNQRLLEHRSLARRGYKSHLYNWMRSVGPENVELVVLTICSTEEELSAMEIAWIESLHNSVNGTSGGEGSLGRVVSEETRRKISETKKKKGMSPAQIAAAAKNRGKPIPWMMTPEVRAKAGRAISEARRRKYGKADPC